MPKDRFRKAVPPSQEQNDVRGGGGTVRLILWSAAVVTALGQLTSSFDGWSRYWSGNRGTGLVLNEGVNNNNTQRLAAGGMGHTNLRNVPECQPVSNITVNFHSLLEAHGPHGSNYPDTDVRSIYDPSNLDAKGLQPWLIDYLKWHADMRKQFPGAQLLDHPDAPKVLIKVCMERDDHCGGMNDRMQQIPVYMAAQTNRILLYKWMHPHPLEYFLLPNVVDWSVPDSVTIPINDAAFLRSKLVSNGWRPKRSPHRNQFRRLKDDAGLRKEKIVTIITGGDTVQDIKNERAFTNMTEPDSEFGTLWHLFFKPSPAVEQEIMETLERHGLVDRQYVATHVRIRHPSRRSFLSDSSALTSKNGTNEWLSVDSTGLLFEGKSKEMMIDVGTHAVNCTNLLREYQREPIYFFSDSEDLVQYMTSANGEITRSSNETSLSEERSTEIKKNIAPGRIVARDLSKRTVHLDLEDAPDASFYYGAFVDLYLGVAARCVSFGIGNYALLITKISNTNCLQTHERLRPAIARQWGTQLRFLKGPLCPIPAYKAVM